MDDTKPPAGPSDSTEITREELQLAARNHGMPLEALRYDVTPIGLHYLLIHYDIPMVDLATWKLQVTGRVRSPLSLGWAELRSRPASTLPITLECAGNGRARLHPRPVSQPWLFEAVGTGQWTGTPLGPLLEEAGLLPDAQEVLFTGLDRGMEGGVEQFYQRSLPLEAALGEGPLLAWDLNGAPLPPQHGYPLRLVVPGWYGMASVKWLGEIRVLDEPFRGYQHVNAYRYRRSVEEEGGPVTRMAPRALMIPPGIPDFLTRNRLLSAGPGRLEGRAWSGHGSIARVEVSVDGGRHWEPAAVEPSEGRQAWHRWTFHWEAKAGSTTEICCRATDSAGNEQPSEPVWNVGGYAVNAVQRVSVTVVT